MIRTLRSRKTSARGFTLVELMVAVTGGLFISLAVFALAREGSRFYQREARIADATLGAVMGFERLRADIGRAGFLSTPNIREDPFLCGDPVGDTTLPAQFKKLAGVRVLQKGSPANSMLNAAGNDVFPDSIVMTGSYSGNETFPIWNVTEVGATYVVYLQKNTGPLARLGYNTSTDQLTLLRGIFGTGRGLRIQDQSGEIQFGAITDVSTTNGPAVVLSQAPKLRFRETTGAICGLKGNVTGATVNVVNFVQYDVRSLSANAEYAAVYGNPHPYDSDRTELARVELDTTGAEIAGTQELVAEYAVDLQFGLTVASAIANNSDPTLTAIAPGDTTIPDWAGDLETDVTAPSGPHRVRTLRVRLSVRSQEPDRESRPSTTGLYRIGLGVTPSGSGGGSTGGPPYARVRTLQADIGLHNQMGVLW